MKKKITLILTLFLTINILLGQDGPAIVFETSKASVSLSIKVSKTEYEDQVWIDLNGNGDQDAGEKVTTFNAQVVYPLESSTVRIFGPIWTFNCVSNEITSLDVSGAAGTLNVLSCGSNLLTSLDLSTCEKLATVACEKNLLTSIIPSSYLTSVNMYSNRLDEVAMTEFVNGLQDRTGKTAGSLTLYYGVSSVSQSNQNFFTQAHADIVSPKNWITYVASPSKTVFTGPYSQLASIGNVANDDGLKIIPEENGILVETEKPMSVSVHNLTGQLLYSSLIVNGQLFIPLKKSIYIVNNKKVILI
ncbi:hypothetical protein SDC9_56890 [bioreactor metagenome]|uniref:Internalin-J n=1 Tax=bioreactor metagenome TaxID=1076179 RepID=A0A644X431_9ZZZZ|nr:hypothetical protein [Paludibacter sp.]